MSNATQEVPNETVEVKEEISIAEQVSDKKNRAILFSKMAKVMEDVEWIKKRGWNDFHKYNFVQEADVVDHIRKSLVKNNLACLPPVVRQWNMNGETAIVDVEMSIGCGDTGEIITGLLTVEGADKGDKKFPKAFASATKYFLMKTFLIPTGDDPEGDIRTDKATANGAPPAKNKLLTQQTKQELENQINSLLMQLTQNGYQAQYVYQLCVQEIGKDFQQLNSLTEAELQKIKILLSTELGKATNN